jgi:hypothetical protein
MTAPHQPEPSPERPVKMPIQLPIPDQARFESTPLYSEELSIDLSAQTDEQYFRWFLVAGVTD